MVGIRVCLLTIFLTVVYVITTVLFCNLFFYVNANGSIIKIKNKIVGSKIIGQQFTSSKHFHGRPSLYNYSGNISGNSNYPYYSDDLVKSTSLNYNRFSKINQNLNTGLNLITESASGLDPDITYQGALTQINRIATASKIKPQEIIDIINKRSKS